MIYNRWGEKVFETTDINLGWDGTYQSQAVSSDVFFYSLDLTFYDQGHLAKTGYFSLIR